MLLRELFEAKNGEVAIIFGRFNPPHKGHKAAWEMAAKSPVWYVGTNKSTVGPKDPLPFDVKIKAMEAIWPEVASHIVAETSWLTLASKVYEKHGDVTLYTLTDEDWVTKTLVQYNGKEGPHGFYNFSKIEQRPTPRLSSATALRDAVMKGDRDAFSDAAGVPADLKVAGKPFFDLVAEYLLPYANAPAKAKKTKETYDTDAKRNSTGSVAEGFSKKFINRHQMDPGAYDVPSGSNINDYQNNNIMIQLIKNIDRQGKYPIVFQDGSKLNLSSKISQEILYMLTDLLPKEKHKTINQIIKSKSNFIDFVKNNHDVDEGWKSKVAGAALMGLGALGAATGKAKADDYGMSAKAPMQASQSIQWLDDPSIPDNLPGKVAGSRFPTKAPVGTKYGSFLNSKGEKINAYVDHDLTSRFVPDKEGEWKPQSFPTNAPVGTKYGSFTDKDGKKINKYVGYDMTPVFKPDSEGPWNPKDKDTKEDAAGVGIVTKQNTTADVGPRTIKKNLKAFKL